MKYLFINGSLNPNGNTAALAAELLEGKNYKSLNLTDYIIGAYGQELPGDGLETVIANCILYSKVPPQKSGCWKLVNIP